MVLKSDLGKGLFIGYVFCIVLNAPSQADVTTQVQTSGYAAVFDGDIALAFEQAKRAALREAVEEATGTLVSARSLAQNFSLIEDQVLTHTKGYVRSYHIASHGIDSTMGYRVELEAIVDLGNLHKHLDALEVINIELGSPRLICLGTFATSEGQTDYMTEEFVVDRLVSILHGANDQLQISRSLSSPFKQTPDVAEKADIAVVAHIQINAADPILIPFGDATLEDIGIQQINLETRIEAWWIDSGEHIAQLSDKEKTTALSQKDGVHQAFYKSMDALAEPLVRSITDNWRKKVYVSRILQLEIQAVPALIQRFEKDFPKQIRGIQGLQVRRYESEFAAYDVHANCAAFQIARQLSAKGMASLDIKIDRVTSNTLKLSLSKSLEEFE